MGESGEQHPQDPPSPPAMALASGDASSLGNSQDGWAGAGCWVGSAHNTGWGLSHVIHMLEHRVYTAPLDHAVGGSRAVEVGKQQLLGSHSYYLVTVFKYQWEVAEVQGRDQCCVDVRAEGKGREHLPRRVLDVPGSVMK